VYALAARRTGTIRKILSGYCKKVRCRPPNFHYALYCMYRQSSASLRVFYHLVLMRPIRVRPGAIYLPNRFQTVSICLAFLYVGYVLYGLRFVWRGAIILVFFFCFRKKKKPKPNHLNRSPSRPNNSKKIRVLRHAIADARIYLRIINRAGLLSFPDDVEKLIIFAYSADASRFIYYKIGADVARRARYTTPGLSITVSVRLFRAYFLYVYSEKSQAIGELPVDRPFALYALLFSG